jgi:prepilin peptidase CpaA
MAALAVLIAALVASYFDVRTRRIPNWLTGALAVAGLGLNAAAGWRAVAVAAGIMAVLLLLGSLLYARGGIGGGDIKLAAAAAGTLSIPLCVPFLLYTAIGGGLLAIGFVVVRAAARTQTLPYAPAFAFGAVLILLSLTVAPFLRILT